MKTNMSVIFIIFFITSISAHFSPEKEIKTIQTLPRKPQATLDIEVTKVKSQEITGEIDEKNKVITVDFNEILNSRKNKINIDRSQYEVYPIEDLGILQFAKNKSLFNKITQNKFQVTKTDTSININYENKPEKLYLGVFNKNTSDVEKVFKLNLEKNILPRASVAKTYTLTNPIFIRSGDINLNVQSIGGTQGIYKFGLTSTGVSFAEGTSSYGYYIDNPFASEALQGLSIYIGGNGSSNTQPVNSTLNTSYGGQSSNNIFIYFPTRGRDWNNFAIYNNSTSGFNSGNARTNISLLRYLNGDNSTISRFVVFGAWGQATYRAGFEILKWNLEEVTFSFKNSYAHDITWNINIPRFDPSAYYDNISPHIILNSNIAKEVTLNDLNNGIHLGSVKIKNLPNLASDAHGGMRFVGNNNVILSNGTKNINGTIYMTPIGNDNSGVVSNPYMSNTDKSTALNIYFKSNNTSDLDNLEYSSNNNRLLKLEVVNKNNFNVEIINSLKIKILKEKKSANLQFKNPLPKAYSSNKGIFSLDSANTSETKNPIGMTTNFGTLSLTSNTIKSSLGYSQYNFRHKVAIWFDWGSPTATTIRKFFQVDSNGKIEGTHEKDQSVAGDIAGSYERDWIKYSVNNGILSIGMKEWRTYKNGSNPANPDGQYIMKIAHFKDNISIDNWISEELAFAVDSYNISFETLKPEIYYNESSSIKLGGTQQIKIPRNTQQISLGKVSLKSNTQIDREVLKGSTLYPIQDFSFYPTNEKIIFRADDGSIIEGQIEISGNSNADENGRDIILHILTDKIDSKKIYTTDATLAKLGTPANKVSNEVFYPITNRLELTLEDSFIADFSVADLDFGAAIANNEAYNEAKTILNLTLADDIINPSLVYAIKTSSTTTNNYYTDFKLHPNGVETAGDFVTTDIWLGNEVKDTNNTQKRSIDINGKVKDISNANVTTSSIPYQNTVELIIKIQ